MKNYYILLLMVSLLFSCSKDEKPLLRDRDIAGTFELVMAKRNELSTDENGYTSTKMEFILTECGLKNQIIMNSDGTFELIEVTGSECGNSIKRKGSWSYLSTSFSSWNGELKFDNSPVIYDSFTISGSGNDTHINNISITAGEMIQGTTNTTQVRYFYHYQRLSNN